MTAQHDDGRNGAQGNGHRETQTQESCVSPLVRPEIGDPHPAGVGEQYPDQRDFSHHLDDVRIRFDLEQLQALRHDEASRYEEDRCGDGCRPGRECSPDEDRGQDQTQRAEFHGSTPFDS
jgi:hypothetical protein